MRLLAVARQCPSAASVLLLLIQFAPHILAASERLDLNIKIYLYMNMEIIKHNEIKIENNTVRLIAWTCIITS